MNIDLTDNNISAKTIIDLLGLAGKKFYGQKVCAEELITNFWNLANNIWKAPMDTSFTDHSLVHSYRIINFFLAFDKMFAWSDYSKLVFTLAALIHDIGMQYRYWYRPSLLEIKEGEKSIFYDIYDCDCTDEFIRLHHCELGFKYVITQIENPHEDAFMWKIVNNSDFNDAIYAAAYIAFSHSSNNPYFEEFQDITGYDDKDLEYSPRLLACILRLCDEIDCSHERIVSQRLTSGELEKNPYGYCQWLTCKYIFKSVINISADKNIPPNIEIKWQVPKNSTSIDSDLIRKFLITNRIEKINHEKELIIEYLKKINDKGVERLVLLEVNPLSSKPKESSTIKTLVRDRSTMLRYTYNRDISDERIIHIDSFIDDTLSKNLIEGKKEIQTQLVEWFYQSIEPNHYVLETTDHTNVLLNCRSLISNQELLTKIAFFIKEYFTHIKQNIDCVLAIGTSAIPIAVNFQAITNCNSTFTMSIRKSIGEMISTKKNQSHEEYIPTEIIPIIDSSNNILIIDDIISIGDVTENIVVDYLNSTEIDNIYHFSLFRLGSRKIIKPEKIKKYLWFCHFPWVYYWRENGVYKDSGKCKYCESNIEIIYEKNYY